MNHRVLYCHCAYARVVPEAVKNEVLTGLAAAGIDFEAVPDLCEMSARRDPRLAAWAASPEPIRLAACYPRAVKWLFSAAGAPLPEDHVQVCNMRELPADQILTTILEARP